MNILPKKNWHVKSKTNIARVKADEAKAAELEKIEQERIRNAEQEARIRLLRQKSRGRIGNETNASSVSSSKPLNLFFGGEDGKNQTATNKQHELEKKAEKEKQEKAIGLLTYLGQSVLEAQHEKPWWGQSSKTALKRSADPEANKMLEEWESKKKQRLDPLSTITKVTSLMEVDNEKKRSERLAPLSREQQSLLDKLPLHLPDDIDRPVQDRHRHVSSARSSSCSSSSPGRQRRKHRKKKKKKEKKKSKKAHRSEKTQISNTSASGPSSSLEILRAERLRRERAERNREVSVIQRFCLKQMGETPQLATEPVVDERQMPYNSAFNPELSHRPRQRRRRTNEDLVSEIMRDRKPR